jgi:hypothetical protein
VLGYYDGFEQDLAIGFGNAMSAPALIEPPDAGPCGMYFRILRHELNQLAKFNFECACGYIFLARFYLLAV